MSTRAENGTLLGFAWGFRIEAEQIVLEPPSPVESDAWNGHRPALSERVPDWRFCSGFRTSD